MSNAVICTNEFIAQSGLTFAAGSTVDSSYPVTNLQIMQPGERTRITTSLADTSISVSGMSETVDLIGALYTNLTRHRNMLQYSNTFDDAVWTATNLTVTAAPGASSAPGIVGGYTLDDDTSAGQHDVVQSRDFLSTEIPAGLGASGYLSETFTGTVYVAQSTGDIDIRLRIESSSSKYMQCSFDLSAGTAGTPSEDGSGDWTSGAASIASVPVTIGSDTWYRLTLTATYAGGSASTIGLRVMLEDGGAISYTGSNNIVSVQAAQLENASSASAPAATTTNVAAFVRYFNQNTASILSAWRPAANDNLSDLPFLHVFHKFSSSVGVGNPFVGIFDPGNTDGYIEIGNMLVALTLQPGVTANLGWSLEYLEDSQTEQALGGQLYRSITGRPRRLTLTHEWMSEAEAMAGAIELDRQVGASEGVFASIDPDNSNSQRWSVWGYQDLSQVVHKRYVAGMSGNAYRRQWTITEALP